MHTFIKLLYSLLIAGSITAFTILSIYTFYQPPKAPDYNSYGYSDSGQSAYNKAYDAYTNKNKSYQKNISYVEMPVALIVTVAGILLFKRTEVIGEGVALGGIFVSIGAITAASIGEARIPRFIAVIIMLASVILVAYSRFSNKNHRLPTVPLPPHTPQPPTAPVI